MRKLFSILLLSGLFLSANAQTADEILDKHISAIGGKDKWLAVKTITMDGKLTIQGTEVDVKVTQSHNVGFRQDLTIGGMTGYEMYTTKEGWSYMPFQGQTKPEAKTADEVKQNLDDLDLQGSFIDYKAKGHTIEYLGKEDVEGTECFKLKINRKNSGEQTVFIDPASYMIVRIISNRQMNGQDMQIVVDLSDYRDVSGIKVPFSISQQFGTITMSNIKVNEPVDESIYKPAK